MTPITTPRLNLRPLAFSDAGFIVRLLNDPDWLRFIGDKNVHSPEDAVRYITNGPHVMYAKHGVGLWLVSLNDGDEPMGLCGLIKRDGLDDVDLGFAFLPAFRGKGYAREAAEVTLDWGRRELGLKRVVAITSQDNTASGTLLLRLGFVRAGDVVLPSSPEVLHKYSLDWI